MSPVILVYVYASLASEVPDSGASRHFYVFPASQRAAERVRGCRGDGREELARSSSSEADVRAGALRGLVRPSHGTSFSRLRRSQAVRAPTPCRYCAGTSEGPSPPRSCERDSSTRFYSDRLHCFCAISCHPATARRGR